MKLIKPLKLRSIADVTWLWEIDQHCLGLIGTLITSLAVSLELGISHGCQISTLLTDLPIPRECKQLKSQFTRFKSVPFTFHQCSFQLLVNIYCSIKQSYFYTPFVPLCLSCLKSQIFKESIIYCVVYLLKMYKFPKLPLNKFIKKLNQ